MDSENLTHPYSADNKRISGSFPATIPLPMNWEDHIEDFQLSMGRPWAKPFRSEQELQQLYKTLGGWFDERTGRPQPFQMLDCPYHMVYTPIPALISVYNDGRLEDNYTVLLRTICRMQACGVKVIATPDKTSPPKLLLSDWEDLDIAVHCRATRGDFQLIYPQLSSRWRTWFARLLTRCKLIETPVTFPTSIVLPKKEYLLNDIFDAVRWGDDTSLEALLNSNVNINARNQLGQTPLILALWNKRTEVASKLIKLDADVNASPASGWTALMSAAMIGSNELLSLLLAHGATVNACSLTFQTPLRVAVVHGYDTCVRLLIDDGAILDPVDDTLHYTTLMFACTACSTETIELLIEKGASVNVMSLDHMTPLRCAEAAGRTDLVSILRKHGATT